MGVILNSYPVKANCEELSDGLGFLVMSFFFKFDTTG